MMGDPERSVSLSNYSEADMFHPPGGIEARRRPGPPPLPLSKRLSARDLLHVSGLEAETHTVDAWGASISGGEPLARSVVLRESGFYVLSARARKGSSSAASSVISSPEPPSEAMASKKVSKRERLRKRVASLRKGKRVVSLGVKVRDVHHVPVFVMHMPPGEEAAANIYGRALEKMVQPSNASEAGAGHEIVLAISESGSSSEEVDCSSCFFLDSDSVPSVMEVSIVSNRSAFVATTLTQSHKESDPSIVKLAPSARSFSDTGRELLLEALKTPKESAGVTEGLQRQKTWPRSSEGDSDSLTEGAATSRVSMDDMVLSFESGRGVTSDFGFEDDGQGLRPEVTDVSGGMRHRRAHSLFARYSEYESTRTIGVDDENRDEIAEDESEAAEDYLSKSDPLGIAIETNSPLRKGKPIKDVITESAHLSAMVSNELNPYGIQRELSAREGRPSPRGAKRDFLSTSLVPLVVKGKWFREFNGPTEPLGRAVLLRGVNLSGNTKLPFHPDSHSHLRFDWGALKDPKIAEDISFVGRPFPLNEATEHFSRLRRWGFNCLRFLVTWEAIEHAGPKKYDEDYLDYVEMVVGLAGSHGFYVFIDPHQDVWSRMTGGSGAPAWTLGKAGLDLAKLEKSEAAFTHNNSADPTKFQRMSWPQNYQRFAAAHMFTLFWGGNDFAPNFSVDGGIPIQEYLQRHFIDAMLEVVKRVCNMSHVLGFDSFNEPSPGFIGCSLDEYPEPIIPPGPVFKPFDAMVAAAGIPRLTYRANGIGMLTGKYLANESGASAWLPGAVDVWREHGVWDVVERVDEQGTSVFDPVLLKPHYFRRFPRGERDHVEFFRDYLRPFMVLYISRIRSIMPRAILFAEGDGFGDKEFIWDLYDPQGIVNASHWYDGYTLFTANFNPRFSVDVTTKLPVFGARRICAMHLRDLKAIIDLPKALDGTPVEMPTLIGEFGIPYNMNNKFGFKTGDFSMHEKALSMYYDVMDALQLHSTQWNYCADNSNEWGDNWNLEDLSLFSKDQQTQGARENIDSGGRAIAGFCRPYVPFVAGMPIQTTFNRKSKMFVHCYEPSPRNFEYGKIMHATEIFVPDIHYISKHTESVVQFDIIVQGGRFRKRQLPGRHILYIWADHDALASNNNIRAVTIRITPRGE